MTLIWGMLRGMHWMPRQIGFRTSVGDIVGPFDSDLGPALFRINGILDAQTVTLEDARGELEDNWPLIWRVVRLMQ